MTTAEILAAVDTLSDQVASLSASNAAAYASISTRIDALRTEVEAIPDPSTDVVAREEFAALSNEVAVLSASLAAHIAGEPIEPPTVPPVEPPPVDPPVVNPPPGGERKTVLAASGNADDLIAAVAEAGADKSIVRIPPGDFNLDKIVVAPDTCSFGAQGAKPRLQKTHGGEEFSGPAFAVFHTGQPTVHEFAAIILLARKATDREIGVGYYGAVNVRPHDNEFHDFGRSPISLLGGTGRFNAQRGQPVGVAWNNLHKDGLNSGGFLGYGVEIFGDERFAGNVRPGSAEMFIMEDDVFDGRRHSTASNNYAIYAVRHCIVRNQLKNASSFDMHGLSSWPAGAHWVEIYENTIESNTPGLSGSNWGIGIRGGGGVAFNNKWQSHVTNGHIAIVIESSGSKPTDAERAVWTTGSAAMPQAGDPLWTKQFAAWDNFDMNGKLVTPIPKSNSIVLGRDVMTSQPADYKALAYPHPGRAGYELAA